MIRPRSIPIPLLAPALLAAPAAAQSVQSYQLPSTATPTPTPTAQGPIDPDNPLARAPRVIGLPPPTATPTPTPRITLSPSPVPNARATPAITLPPTVRPSARATRSSSPSPAAPATPDTAAPQDSPAAPQPAPTPVVSSKPGTLAQPDRDQDGSGLPWWIAALALLVAAGGGLAFFRHRSARPHARKPRTIEPPRIDRAPAPVATPAPTAARTPARIELTASAVRVTRSFANLTLAYRFDIANRGASTATDVRIAGDIASAHGDLPLARQLAEPGATLPPLHEIATLAPGEACEFTGELRLPLQAVRPIWQGKAPLVVPLLRLVLAGEGIAAEAHTLVIGRRPDRPGGQLQPFRLDEQPQTYRTVAAKPLG